MAAMAALQSSFTSFSLSSNSSWANASCPPSWSSGYWIGPCNHHHEEGGDGSVYAAPDLGYGATGRNGVPSNCVTQFEVDLISWITVVDVCKNDGIIKKWRRKNKLAHSHLNSYPRDCSASYDARAVFGVLL